MYLVRGYESISEFAISSSESGLRRHAMGFIAPFRYAFSATRESVERVIPNSCMYRLIFIPKNWVVRARPDRPYHSPISEVLGRNAPRSCLSKPMAMPRSNIPDLTEFQAENRAEPPVAQPFMTLMNCKPVRPNFETIRSAAPADLLPPKANCMSCQARPESARALRTATTPCSMPETPSWRPNSCMPMPTITTSLMGETFRGEGERHYLFARLVDRQGEQGQRHRHPDPQEGRIILG